ncbi:response regulator [Paenibacillus guangzhouensis]|uniref:response regulator n=1 Tax=Paenibacillus guangzhouensis TaxID=1473112 RepID=UPI001266D94A|nr:response regulator [Paenibacillus guangzhouensis]
MYNLILVDDEEDVREGLMQEIDWESHGFHVVERAENGKEAMELIEKVMPDIVVTDIHMPFMNGLQLAEWVRKAYPSMKIIILTGYDEFEYAQKAIKLQIDEYVLKPFSASDLIEALLKVKEQMDKELCERQNLNALQEKYQKSLPVLRSVFLSSLITRSYMEAEIHEKGIQYDMELICGPYLVSVIQMDHNRFTQGDAFLLQFAMLNIAEEIVQHHNLGYVFIHHNHVVVLSMLQDADEHGLSQTTMEVMEEIRLNVHKFLKFTVTIGVGSIQYTVTELHASYPDAIQALNYRLLLGNDRVIWIQDVETRRHNPLILDEMKEQALIRCIKVGMAEEAQEMIQLLFHHFVEESAYSIQDFQIYCTEILMAIIRVAKDMEVPLESLFGSNQLPIAEITSCPSVHEARQWMTAVCLRLMEQIAVGRQTSYKKLVEEAKAYMKAHFAESDMSIQRICQHLHISAGYFSNIFKKEAKTTFVNHLLDLRMEAAKEMLRTTDMKAFEIAEQVGYSDANYFSFCFRKKFGLSPKDYRNGART